MAHCQLGQHDRARRWYAQAVLSMEKNQPKHPELLNFRNEAHALLESIAQNEAAKPAVDPTD
jgi:hypothetical protein